MKILVLTTKPPWPPHDGSAVASKSIIEGLAMHGAEMAVLSITTQKHEAIDKTSVNPPLPLSVYKKLFIDTTVRPVPLVTNFIFSSTPYDIERFYSHKFMRLIASLPDLKNYDIIQCEGLVFALYVTEIRALTGARVVLRAHNLEHQIREMMAEGEKFLPKRIYLKNLAGRIRHLESRCRGMFDAIVTITDKDKRWFDDQPGDAPVIVAETGIQAVTEANDLQKGRCRVGFIGALDWQPNIRGLIWFIREVWPVIVKQSPDASLIIAGRNASKATVWSLKGPNIIFEGEINDAAGFTSSMTVMIAPLFAGSGMRIKIIEAMKAGVPVVASPVAASGIPVIDNHNILLADNSNEFASAVLKMLGDSSESNRITANANSLLKENYDNNKITSHLYGFYKVLTNDR